jgi:polyisoprenoid-binding protein YceI
MQVRDVTRRLFLLVTVAAALGRTHAIHGEGPHLAPGDINLEASRVYIFVDKTGFGHQHAVEGRLAEGKLRVAGRAAGRMVFDLQSFKADTTTARRYLGLKSEFDKKTQDDVTANMHSPDVLDVARFSTATFAIDSFQLLEDREKSGKMQYRFDGEFKLHGTKHPLRFIAEGTQERGYLHLKGSFRMRQSDYRITPFKKALGAVGVADALTVHGDIWVKQ